MEKKKDMLEQHLAENFKKLAGEEEQQIENIKNHESEDDIRMPEGTKEAIRAKLDDEIEKIKEAEREEIYSRLIQEEKERAKASGAEEVPSEESTKKHTRKRHGRKPWKIYIAVAAVLITMGAVGITAVGGPERMIVMVRQAVGDREVEKVNSSDENLVIVEEDEEEAYQKISDKFGVDHVKIIKIKKKKNFDRMEYDSQMQTAEFIYRINDEVFTYLMSASYRESSWGIDVEDTIVEQYEIEVEENSIQIKEYSTRENNVQRMSAQFSHQGVEYFMLGSISKQEFENVIKNLHFY